MPRPSDGNLAKPRDANGDELPEVIDDPSLAKCEVIEADIEAMIAGKARTMVINLLEEYGYKLQQGTPLQIMDKYFILACFRTFAAAQTRKQKKKRPQRVINLSELNEQEVEILWQNSQRRLLETTDRGNGGGGMPIPHADG